MDLALDADGDLDLQNGRVPLVRGGDAVAQRVRIRLQMVRGEWYLDQRLGLPWFESVLVKNPDLSAIRALFRRAILSTPGVASLERLELDFDEERRTLHIDCAGTTVEGGAFEVENVGFIA